MRKPVICTIGYSGLAPVKLRNIAEIIDADVVDCRCNPTSRNAAYRQGPLSALLGARYIWAGNMLGGRGNTSPEGFRWLAGRKRNSLLLCMCHAPGDCHRHADICAKAFPDAIHIFDDELFLASDLEQAIRKDCDYDVLGSLDDVLAGRTMISDLV